MAWAGSTSMCFFVMILLAYNFPTVAAQPNTQAADEPMHITVDQHGYGDYKKVQDAIEAVPSNNSELVFIWVKPGIYREKVWVSADKPFITITGAGQSETIITWNECGPINAMATFTVLASDFIGRSLTIQNTYGKGAQAVALRVSGDRAAFYDCSIKGYQDALFDDAGRHYYSNCYIEGATDFIFGSSASIFQGCHLHSISEDNGAITAQRRYSPSENWGFTFLGCIITGIKKTTLGRPWGPYARVVFAYTHMTNAVLPQGWDDWGRSPYELRNVYFGQYKCWGPGADTSQRVKWAHEVSLGEVLPLLTRDFIDGRTWLRAVPFKFEDRALVSSNITSGNN